MRKIIIIAAAVLVMGGIALTVALRGGGGVTPPELRVVALEGSIMSASFGREIKIPRYMDSRTYDSATRRYSAMVRASAENLAVIGLDVRLVDFTAERIMRARDYRDGLRVSSLRLQAEDAGFMDVIFRQFGMLVSPEGNPEAGKAFILSFLPGSLNSKLSRYENRARIQTALESFINDPGIITVTAEPSMPVSASKVMAEGLTPEALKQLGAVLSINGGTGVPLQ